MAQKLKALKVDLKKWNKEAFRDVRKLKKEMEVGIGEIDLIVETRSLVEDELFKREEYSR